MSRFDVDLCRQAFVALTEYACGGPLGRSKDDPVYVEVTEHRDGPSPARRARYSSCGDQPHWLLWRMGLRAKWINRAALGQYRDGMNIVEVGMGCPISAAPPNNPDWRPAPGTICEIWNDPQGRDAHAFIVLGPGSDSGHIRTANYGAGGMSPALSPGANIADSPFVHHPDGWFVGAHARKLQRIIEVADATALITAQIDLTGAGVAGELLGALQAKYGASNV